MTTLDSILREPFNLRNDIDNITLQEDRYPRNVDNSVPWKARIYYYRKRSQVRAFLRTMTKTSDYLNQQNIQEEMDESAEKNKTWKMNNLKACSMAFALESTIFQNVITKQFQVNRFFRTIEVQLFFHFDAKPQQGPVKELTPDSLQRMIVYYYSLTSINLRSLLSENDTNIGSIQHAFVVFLLNCVPYFRSNYGYFELDKPEITSVVLAAKIRGSNFDKTMYHFVFKSENGTEYDLVTYFYELFECYSIKKNIFHKKKPFPDTKKSTENAQNPIKNVQKTIKNIIKQVKSLASIFEFNDYSKKKYRIFSKIFNEIKPKKLDNETNPDVLIKLFDKFGINDLFLPPILQIEKTVTASKPSIIKKIISIPKSKVVDLQKSVDEYFKYDNFLLYPSEFVILEINAQVLDRPLFLTIELLDGRTFAYKFSAAFFENAKQTILDFCTYKNTENKEYTLRNNAITEYDVQYTKTQESGSDYIRYLLIFSLNQEIKT